EWSAASSDQRAGLFEGYAKALGLDMSKYTTDITSEQVMKKIKYDQAIASAAGVTGTPTVYLNGQKVDGKDLASTATIKALLDTAIKNKK
ncbi:MAG: DsbA family protein, partial [Candidatus Saccharimonadales bacterium]